MTDIEEQKHHLPHPFRCLTCGGGANFPFCERAPDYYLRTTFVVDYVKCVQCGLVQQHPLPADVGPFYNAYPVHAGKTWLHEVMRRILLHKVYFDAAALPDGAVLLDYGCGDGWFLDAVRRRPVTRLGFELDPAQAEAVAQNTNAVIYHDWDDLEGDWGGRVDQVTMHFVLEHLTDLDDSLGRLARLLRPGGQIYAVVPHIDCLEFRWFGKRWHGLDAPRHIAFPDQDQLAPLLAQKGLALTERRTVRFPNTFAGSLAIVLGGHFRQPLFLLTLPLGIFWTWWYPKGNVALEIRKNA